MAGGVITLGEMRARGMVMLEVARRRRERRGRLGIDRLIAEHGAGALDLRAIITADWSAHGTPRPRSMSATGNERDELGLTLHGRRHTLGDALMELGGDPDIVRAVLGEKSISASRLQRGRPSQVRGKRRNPPLGERQEN